LEEKIKIMNSVNRAIALGRTVMADNQIIDGMVCERGILAAIVRHLDEPTKARFVRLPSKTVLTVCGRCLKGGDELIYDPQLPPSGADGINFPSVKEAARRAGLTKTDESNIGNESSG
jgi:hypothetical protein